MYDDVAWVGPSSSEGRRVLDTVLALGAMAAVGGPLVALVVAIEINNLRLARRARRRGVENPTATHLR